MSWSYNSPFLGMPFLLPSQAQKHVTVNDALRVLDALAQLAVKNRSLTSPPISPAEGDRHIVAASATGAWSGKSDQIAAFIDGAWRYHPPKEGFTAWVISESALVYFDGSGWQEVSAASSATLLGVNATADTTNRLTVASPATLFSHEGAGHQAKINKAGAADTASILFQTGLAGRAEIGLIGDDDLTMKVFGSDTVWRTAISVDRDTGAVSLPNTSSSAMTLIAIVKDVKTVGAEGGAFSSGARRTRDLNTLTEVVSGVTSLASNTLTVAPGTYFFRWSCPAYRVGLHRSFLRDATNNADLGLGSSETASSADLDLTSSAGVTVATFAVPTDIRLEHRCAMTQATSGFGVASGFAEEVYSSLEVWRL
ncbi:MAG TPA: DUF2793 domain-containing protein [Rhizobiaceae bacterium]|nr:DUF2793 domain-containing protein [Rhizobiaceae bacterium]